MGFIKLTLLDEREEALKKEREALEAAEKVKVETERLERLRIER